MEDQGKGHHHQQGQIQQQHPHPQDSNSPSHGSERSEPVRSRWTPKPEQILILESIFNSGMVNPPKEETVRIRKLLEKFGSVGDANVFYWFQNRRSRSRRRQRQLQASLDHRNQLPQPPQLGGGATAIPYDSTRTDHSRTPPPPPPPPPPPMAFPDLSGSSSSSCGILQNQEPMDPLFSVSPQMGFPEIDPQTSALYPPDPSAFNYHCGLITVFINGVATEVPRGPMDIRTMFGQDVVLVHSSGVPLPTNEFGYLMQSLQHGESYFLMVSKPT